MSKAYTTAVALLARREHGAAELTTKLLQKGLTQTEVNDAIVQCQDLGLQSDLRFVESLCRTRVRQGYGPIRMRQELQSLKINHELIETALAELASSWVDAARAVWKKKYQRCADQSFKMLQKQKQFLRYRGFPGEVIATLFNPNGDEIDHDEEF